MTAEHPPKTPSPRIGLFALLSGLLRAKATTTGGRALITTPVNIRTDAAVWTGNAKNKRITGLVLLPVILLFFALAGTASANSAHGFLGELGTGAGSKAGQLALAAPISVQRFGTVESANTFGTAGSGVAVNDATHDVYVADTGNRRVDEFDPSKPSAEQFVRAFGAKVEPLGADTCTLLTECQQGAVGTTPGELPAEMEAPRFVAVDNAPGASHGDVYVGTGVGRKAQNTVEFVEISAPSKGSFTLSFEGETTAPIAYDSEKYDQSEPGAGPNATAVREALEALSKVGHGNVFAEERTTTRTGRVVRGLTVEFGGALKEKPVGLLGCDAAGLTPAGSECHVNVVQEGSGPAGEVVEKFSAAGVLEEAWGVKGRLESKQAPAEAFGGLAVDSAGHLWLYDGQTAYEFEEDGTPVKSQSLGFQENGSASGLAVDGAGDLYVVGTEARNCVQSYTPTGGGPVCVSAEHIPDPSGFALDTSTGGLYVGLGSSLEQVSPREVFGSEQLQAGGGAGVAVDSSNGEQPFSGSVYATNTVADQVDVFPEIAEAETAAASEVQTTSMVLNGVVNPLGSDVGECFFEYGTTNEYGQRVQCTQSPEAIGQGKTPVPVSAKLEALRGGTTYHFRLVVTKGTASVPGNDLQARTLTAPVISGGEAPLLDVTASTAQLRANVDPEGLPVSRCQFEYGASTAYGHKVKCEQTLAQIGYGTEPVPVSATLTGLQPNTTYYWRLRVEDEHGEAYEPGHTFVYPTTSGELPDDRAYEMVSPVQKNGASIGANVFGPTYAVAGDGSSLKATSIQCFAEAVSCTGNDTSEGEPFEFSRTTTGTSAEWKTTALAPPASQFGSINFFPFFSPDAGIALFGMPSAPGESNSWYARQPGPEGSFTDIGPIAQPGLFGVESLSKKGLAATADLSHVFWQSEGGNKQWPFAEKGQVVEYVGAHNSEPLLVGVENAGPPPWQAGATHVNDGAKLISSCVSLGEESGDTWNAVSADGRTVYVTACGGALYARVDGETSEAHTIRISPGVASFAGASDNGEKAFFLNGTNCSATGSNCGLYESECTAHCQGSGDEESQEQREPIDVSEGSPAPEVQGVVATSADGSHVYFVADGVLTSAPNGSGQRAAPGHCRQNAGMCNLYVYERDASYPQGHLAFIASVPGTDGKNWGQIRRANVTPEGRFLVVESSGDLTPDDHAGGIQIFRYDADQTAQEASENVPTLVRVSIGNDGYNDDGNAGAGEASIVLSNAASKSAGPARGDPSMSNDGSRIFFESPIGLTPRALNDVFSGYETNVDGEPIKTRPFYAQNVYEWEQAGVGSCPASQTAGCTYLISDGHDVSGGKTPCGHFTAVCLLGTDEAGKNVFFLTADQLVPKDTDTQEDIYDARICGGEDGPCITEPPPPLPPCDGESCHGIPPERSPLLTGGSETLNGKGNLTSTPPAKPAVKKKTVKCRRGFVKNKKGRCIRNKKHPKGKKSAHTNRRASR